MERRFQVTAKVGEDQGKTLRKAWLSAIRARELDLGIQSWQFDPQERWRVVIVGCPVLPPEEYAEALAVAIREIVGTVVPVRVEVSEWRVVGRLDY